MKPEHGYINKTYYVATVRIDFQASVLIIIIETNFKQETLI